MQPKASQRDDDANLNFSNIPNENTPTFNRLPRMVTESYSATRSETSQLRLDNFKNHKTVMIEYL